VSAFGLRPNTRQLNCITMEKRAQPSLQRTSRGRAVQEDVPGCDLALDSHLKEASRDCGVSGHHWQ
jgi:hypothetical protein